MDIATLSRLIENLIRLGTVAQVQHVPPRVRIQTGELLTGWLPWLAARAGADVDWDPPTIGEQVLVLSPSGQTGNAVVLTGLYSLAIPANADRPGLYRRTFADGAVIEYDRQAHHLRATLPAGGSTELVSDGGIHIVGPITHEGDYTHQGDYTQTGNQQVTGVVQVSEDVQAGPKRTSLVGHVHTGTQPGNGLSGVPA
ncbi:phage baseplate assembly protein V [Pseudomonas mangiferae]|uniref:Phage baseplate assembly protein V n=1 Tax=Pseudomonas mangiferae TaxID=2593654 RepID=A0A553H0K5_9PSED|nr:phage baseplate assembly protein V [Pseudomonas mangiferae]TRX75273.1 phage baseplate assembly protein V [Pseudomonas mangiferae]